jgi:hypothetical protein
MHSGQRQGSFDGKRFLTVAVRRLERPQRRHALRALKIGSGRRIYVTRMLSRARGHHRVPGRIADGGPMK